MFNFHFRKGRGPAGGGARPSSRPIKKCVCPNCGQKIEIDTKQNCGDQVCPECGSKMNQE